LEHEAHRRTDQLETLAEEVLQVSRIRGRQRLQARAMDDEGWRVLAARMRETQLGRVPAHDRRRARLVGDLERAGGIGGAELARGRGMRAGDRSEQLAQ